MLCQSYFNLYSSVITNSSLIWRATFSPSAAWLWEMCLTGEGRLGTGQLKIKVRNRFHWQIAWRCTIRFYVQLLVLHGKSGQEMYVV